MKAIVLTKYASPDVLQLKSVEKPAFKDDKVVVKIYATSVASGMLNFEVTDSLSLCGSHVNNSWFQRTKKINTGVSVRRGNRVGRQ